MNINGALSIKSRFVLNNMQIFFFFCTALSKQTKNKKIGAAIFFQIELVAEALSSFEICCNKTFLVARELLWGMSEKGETCKTGEKQRERQSFICTEDAVSAQSYF